MNPAGHIQIATTIPGAAEIEEKDGVAMRAYMFRQLRIAAIAGLRGAARRHAVAETDGRKTGIIIGEETPTDNSYTIDLKCKVVFYHNQ